MKKIISVFFIISVICMLCACSPESSAAISKPGGPEAGSEASTEKAATAGTGNESFSEKTTTAEAGNESLSEKATTEEAGTEETTEIIFTIEDQNEISPSGNHGGDLIAEEIFLGSPVTADNIQFTLTGISGFLEQYALDENNVYDVPDAENYSFICADFTLMNPGKEAVNPSYINMEILTGEGRIFPANRIWHYDADCLNLDTLEKGAWTATAPKIEAADGEREGVAVFQLSDKILDSETSLELRIAFKEKVFFYMIR